MAQISLDNGLGFSVERYEKRVRLIVYEQGVEKVCRKESLKNLMQFAQSDGQHLFKGRLQLDKNGANIMVSVKGEIVGKIGVEKFVDCLEEAMPL